MEQFRVGEDLLIVGIESCTVGVVQSPVFTSCYQPSILTARPLKRSGLEDHSSLVGMCNISLGTSGTHMQRDRADPKAGYPGLQPGTR